MLQTKVKRKTYKEKIAEFNKLYGPFEFIDHVEAQDGWRCEACGSHAPGISSFTRIDSGTYAMSVENATRILSRPGREDVRCAAA